MQNEALNEMIAKLLAIPILMGLLGITTGIIFFIFWIYMLIDCLDNEKEYKTAWVLMLIFLPPVGAILYHRIAKKKKWLINTIFVSGLILGGISILTVAYIGKYGSTAEIKKTSTVTRLKSKPLQIKKRIHTQSQILNLPYKFSQNLPKINQNIYTPKVSKPNIYRTQRKNTRKVTKQNYIYKWIDKNQQEHFSNMEPPAGTQYTKTLSRY